MRVNITGFMRNMLRPRCSEMVAEFLGHLKELRDDQKKHGEFFDLYVFSDDDKYRDSLSCTGTKVPAEGCDDCVLNGICRDTVMPGDDWCLTARKQLAINRR